jgi:hypothetical protein
MPAQRQPLVLTHPVTGRRSLYGFNEGTENALLSFQPWFYVLVPSLSWQNDHFFS